MLHTYLELAAAYYLTSEVCSEFVKAANLKLIVLLDQLIYLFTKFAIHRILEVTM